MVGGCIYHFDPFCAKVIGMKGLALPDTTSSRGIIVKLWPKKPDEKISNFAFADDDDFVKLRRKLLRWSADNAATLKDARPDLPPGFGNRIAANWKVLLAIADLAGDAYGRRARQAAVQLSHRRRQSSEGVRLLDALRTIFGTDEMLTSDEVVKRLTSDPNSEWCEFRGHGPITKRQVAVLLEQYDIRPAVIHPTRRSNFSARGYKAEWFVEVFARCLPAMRTSVHSQRKTRIK
jgi:putative DNA primase/helicase